MKKFYLIGNNIEKSLSPFIHNALFEKKKIKEYHYALYKDSPPSLEKLQNDKEFGGFSITIPYKKYYESEDSIIYNDGYGKKSKVINTFIKKSNSFEAYNTDLYGIQKTL